MRNADASSLRLTAWTTLAVAYWLTGTLSHDWVSQIYMQIFQQFGRDAMEAGVHLLSLGGLIALFVFAWLLERRAHAPRLSELLRWALALGGLWAADALLVSTNIERVHYPQYAILAMLLKRIVDRDSLVLLLCVGLGIMDEFLQYVLFPHYTKYLDFNDFVLNLAGAVLGLMLARGLGLRGILASRAEARLRAAVIAGYAVLALVVLWAWADGRLIAFRPPEGGFDVFPAIQEKLSFVLSFQKSAGFWSVTDYGRRYHILTPGWGSMLLAALFVFYAVLFRRTSAEPGSWRVQSSPAADNGGPISS